MDVWGLILISVGAVLIATGQEIVARVTAMWLRAHEAFLVSLGGGDVQRISGVDDQMDRAVRKNQWLSRVGWSLFVAGIVLQIIPHFRHDGWKRCASRCSICALYRKHPRVTLVMSAIGTKRTCAVHQPMSAKCQ